jgi:protein O-mannosyl-transferase
MLNEAPPFSDAMARVPDQRAGTAPCVWWCRDWLLSLLLIAATLAAYSSSMNGAFVWDDDSWTTNVESLLHDVSGLWRIWSVPEAMQQYYPLAGTTFWMDHHFWGDWTLPYHVENVLLHACSAILLWTLLRRLAVPGAWLAGAIFALHPVMVESVSWITERKNVLSLLFFLGTLLAYGGFDSYWEKQGPRRWIWYWLALLLFCCALLSKVTACMLPPVILLLCWWKRGRIRILADFVPTQPFFALAVAHGLLVAWLEKYHVGTGRLALDLSWPDRCLIAGRAFWFYPGKLIWPANLCFVYPLWKIDPADWLQWLLPGAAVTVLLAAFFMRARLGRGVPAALFFYVGTLFPVLGFMNAFGMLYSYVWDHWVYLSSVGLISLAAGVLATLGARFKNSSVQVGAAAVLLLSLAVLTWRQGRMYRDVTTLWQTTLERNPGCWMAHNNLGIIYFGQARLAEAAQHLEESIKLYPQNAASHANLGTVYQVQGRLDEAIAHYQIAVKIDPDRGEAQRNYAAALIRKGRVGEALTHLYYGDAMVRPGQKRWGGLARLAWILAASPDKLQRDGPIALELSQKANEITRGKNPEVLQILAAAFAECGNFDEAVRTGQEALKLAESGNRFATEMAAQLKGYQAGIPFRDASLGVLPPMPQIQAPSAVGSH